MSNNPAADVPPGLQILIVEDEPLVVMLLEDMLQDLGCHVAISSTIEEALAKAQTETFDAAILDMNLGGKKIDPVAHELKRRGVPFMFASGYGAAGLPEEFQGISVLPKPFEQDALRRALSSLMSGGG